MDAEYTCPHCGELVGTTVAADAGRRQSYVEDCPVCCRPGVLTITLRTEGRRAFADVQADPESDLET
jgi:hypothetical protein